jgi:hypothetical protein
LVNVADDQQGGSVRDRLQLSLHQQDVVFASNPLASVIRLAARPVGAQSRSSVPLAARIRKMALMIVVLPTPGLSFVESAPRAYRLKASNAAPLSSTSAGTFPWSLATMDCLAIEYDPEVVQQVVSNQLSDCTLRGMGPQEKPIVGRYILAFAMRW